MSDDKITPDHTLIQNASFPMSSPDLLAIINGYRKEEGKRAMRHDNFISKIKDELDFSLLLKSQEPYGTKGKVREIVHLDKFQALRVAMRESKEIRCKFAAFLERLDEQPKQLIKVEPDTFMESINAAIANYKADQKIAKKCGQGLVSWKLLKRKHQSDIKRLACTAQLTLDF